MDQIIRAISNFFSGLFGAVMQGVNSVLSFVGSCFSWIGGIAYTPFADWLRRLWGLEKISEGTTPGFHFFLALVGSLAVLGLVGWCVYKIIHSLIKRPVKFMVKLTVWAVILGGLWWFFDAKLLDKGNGKKDDPIVPVYYEGKDKPLKMENDALAFELDPITTYFKVTDKASGFVWQSNPDNADKDPIATKKDPLQSTLIVTSITGEVQKEYTNWKTIMNQVYEIKQDEDSIHVIYTVGDVQRIYKFPEAIAVDQWKIYMDQMKAAGIKTKKVEGLYTKKELAKIKDEAERAELLATYPGLADSPMYILIAKASKSNKEDLEKNFATIGYTDEQFAIDSAMVNKESEADGSVFQIEVIYRLEGNDLVVEVPMDTMRYYAAAPITHLTMLPMFGAAGTGDQGYIMVPEGGGALINYNNGRTKSNAYVANLYGWDYGTERTDAITETRADFPVFGMSRTDANASFICIMEDGSSLASVKADISGRDNSYNVVNAKFALIHFDQYNISSKTEKKVFMFEPNLPEGKILQRYRFLNTSSYVDMAHAYGEYLEQRYDTLTAGGASAEVPVTVDLIGAINKKVVKFGVPVDSVVAVTTFDQAAGIINDLKANDVKALSVTMSGWANGGLNQRVLSSVKTQRQLGGDKGMKRLIGAAGEQDVKLYFDGISTFAYDSGLLRGFFAFSDAARYTTREQIKLYPFYEITYQQNTDRDPYYLANPQYADKMARNLVDAVAGKGAAGVAFRDIGYLLSGNYNPNNATSRETVKSMNVAVLQTAADKKLNVMITHGNAYAMPYATIVKDMDLQGLPYSILDANVPFYQIAIHGMRDYTSTAINLANDYETELLRAAEYGAGLSFTFMNENGWIVQDTEHSYLFGANYGDWKNRAIGMINRYQQAMAGLNQQKIVDHQMVTANVTMTQYEDGTQVYVNYGTAAYEANGVTVGARSYQVVKTEAAPAPETEPAAETEAAPEAAETEEGRQAA